VVLLRLKRTRNPDMVCMELFQRFLQDMRARGVAVLLCGVREDFATALVSLDFARWLPADRVFLENGGPDTSTLRAVRHAYELLGADLCPTCPRRREPEADKGAWHYMI
jgi:SulP family sulfate permease